VSFTIKNTGDMDGKEVAQLYVSDPETYVEKAAQELKGFKKVFVKRGDSENVTILLPVKELAYYNETKKEWLVEPGTYKLKIGNSSRGIKEEVFININ
jgi:beta-glucosidase